MTEVEIHGERFIAEPVRPVRQEISRRAREILTFVSSYVDQHGYAPSLREIVKGTELNSTSAVAHQLRVLEARGYIERAEFVSRAIRVIP